MFPSEKHRNAIVDYSVRNRVDNLRSSCPGMTKTRFRFNCAEGCPWNLHAMQHGYGYAYGMGGYKYADTTFF